MSVGSTPLKNDWAGKSGLLKDLSVWANKVANILNTLGIAGGQIRRTEDGRNWLIIPQVRGDRGLYKVRSLREYDELDVLIAVGSETGTSDASIDSGHSLQETWDYVRIVEPEI